ncbi:MAG TPA: hypothetical protein VKQ28_00675 [Candidatus Acidoferrum sp.]|nr:hypothetical protein [Candidatus Acidoferrum sp.]
MAGEASAEHIDPAKRVLPAFLAGDGEFSSVSANFSDVRESEGSWEMARKHSSAIWIKFDLPDRFDSRSLKAEIETANS